MRKVILTKGLPGSGKSTWAKEQVDKNPEQYKRVNKDDLRAMLDNGHWSKKNEAFIVHVRNQIILAAVLDRFDVIVDDTNFNPKHEQDIRQLIEGLATVEIKEFTVDVDECVERDAKREKPVGEQVIRSMHKNFVRPVKRDVLYVPNPEKPPAIIVDIDGTIAKMNGRSPYDFSRVGEDEPNRPIIEIVKAFSGLGYRVIVLSGRDGVCRPQTEAWLDKHGVPANMLLMRTNGDRRKDNIIKEELFDTFKDDYCVSFVLDDRDQVVEMWRSIGLTCLQVDFGNF